MRSFLLTLLVASAALAAPKKKGTAAPEIAPLSEPAQRELKKRHITITDDNADSIPELHVAPGVPTTLVFAQKVSRAVLADEKHLAFPPTANGSEVIIAVKQDLPAGAVLPLTITLVDGQIQSFQLKSVPAEVDLQVEIELAITKNAAPDSPQALRASNAQLRAQLDECKASGGSAGTAQIAAHILEQDDTSAPQLRTFEGHVVHTIDKQQRLLVEATYLYRLFGLSYLVLSVENRDPTKPWVLDHPELSLAGDSATADLGVQNFVQDAQGPLGPGEKEKIVVAYRTPTQSAAGQKLTITLLEKGGGRHVRLELAP